MLMRNRSYRRYQHKKHAIRHKKITKEVYQIPNYFTIFNKYDSFKIHCSCPMCSAKTRNKGRRRKNKPYAPAINYRRMDLRRQQAMTADELEFYES